MSNPMTYRAVKNLQVGQLVNPSRRHAAPIRRIEYDDADGFYTIYLDDVDRAEYRGPELIGPFRYRGDRRILAVAPVKIVLPNPNSLLFQSLRGLVEFIQDDYPINGVAFLGRAPNDLVRAFLRKQHEDKATRKLKG